MAAVVLLYLFFAGGRRFDFAQESWNHYKFLAEGFARGQLSLSLQPDPALQRLADPYDAEARRGIPCLWDASYFENRYYLYFSPLPVLLFYLPVHWISGQFPTDSVAGCFFFILAFLFAAAAVLEALPPGRPDTRLPVYVWILAVGLGNLVPFTLTRLYTYEVAIACGAAFSSAWAYAILRFARRGGGSGAVLLVGVFGALAMWARPHLAVLALAGAVGIAVLSRKTGCGVRNLALISAPYLAVALLMGGYNLARFHSPFEFGTTYLLTFQRQGLGELIGFTGSGAVARFASEWMHYLFLPPAVSSRFPFLSLQPGNLVGLPAYGGPPEPVGGMFPLLPFIPLGILFAAALFAGKWMKEERASAVSTAAILAAGAGVMSLLCASNWMVSRYENDYLGLLAVAAAAATERMGERAAALGISPPLWQLSVAALVLYSILAGQLLGFSR